VTAAQIHSQYLRDVRPVNNAIAPLITSWGPSVDQIEADRGGIKAALVRLDNQLGAWTTTFENQVGNFEHESSATLEVATVEVADLGMEQTADGILVIDLYAEPRERAECDLSCMDATGIWTTRVIDDALVLPHYQAIVVAGFSAG
jgi:hypothetical protein